MTTTLNTLRSSLVALLMGGSALFAQDSPKDDPDLQKAQANFKKQDYDAVIADLASYTASHPTNAVALNLLGAAYTKKKDYGRARAFFTKALEAEPNFFAADFNIGEVSFLEKNYPESLAHFKGMLGQRPGNELLLFKCFLCELQNNNTEQAEKWLALITYPGQGPAWYYAKAAWELKRGKKGTAAEYIASAKFVFRDKTELFDETFKDLDYDVK